MRILQAFACSCATRAILFPSRLLERIVRPSRKVMYVSSPRPKTMLFTSHERIASVRRFVGDGTTGAGVVADIVPVTARAVPASARSPPHPSHNPRGREE